MCTGLAYQQRYQKSDHTVAESKGGKILQDNREWNDSQYFMVYFLLHRASDCRYLIRPLQLQIRQPKRLAPSRSISFEERFFSQRSNSRSMSSFTSFIIPRCVMNSHTIIPDGTCASSPSETNLNVDVFLIHVVEVVQDKI